MSWCDPNQPCEECGRTQKQIDDAKRRKEVPKVKFNTPVETPEEVWSPRKGGGRS